MDLFESFATATFDYNIDAELPLHPVTFFNVKTKQPIRIDVLPDSGASVTVLQDKYAKLLGVDETNSKQETIEGVGGKSQGGFFETFVPMRIGNLAPVATRVLFGPIHLNVLGRHEGLSHYRTTFTWNKIQYEEFAKRAAAAATAAYAIAGSKSYRNRI